MKLLHRLADNRVRGSLASQLRRRRFAFFESLTQSLARPFRLLDVGGTPSFWEMMEFEAVDCEIVVLNIRALPVEKPNITSVAGDARAMDEYADSSFDVVFSNSVIEHVGSYDDQRRMAEEVRRVGRRYFVQTPNRYFPIEPHFLVPFWQFLPLELRARLVQRFDVGWFKRRPNLAEARALVGHIRLLTKAELRALFPDGSIYTERLMGLPKSYVVYGGW